MMRCVQAAVLSSIVAGVACNVCAAEDVSVAAHVASMPAGALQLMLADPAHPDGRRWIVWDDAIGDTRTAHIALCDRSGQCAWSHTWPDAYDPAIQYMSSWSTQKTALFLVTYNEGAAAQTAVVVELPHAQPPRILDRHDGAWIAVAPGEDYLEAATDSGASASLLCLGWNRALRRLHDVHCSRHHVEER